MQIDINYDKGLSDIANNIESMENTERTAQTVATPVSNKVVIVDAGHGTPDERSRK